MSKKLESNMFVKTGVLRTFLLLLFIFTLFQAGCNLGSSGGGGSSNTTAADSADDGNTQTDDGSTTTSATQSAQFNLTLTSYSKNSAVVGSNLSSSLLSQASPELIALNPKFSANATNLVSGTILVVNQATGKEKIYNWALEIDEDAIEITTEVTLPLNKGVYDFYFLMSAGDRQYAAITGSWIVLKGNNAIPFLIHPVIGEQIPDIHILTQLSEFQFQYDTDVVSQFKKPAFGITIDGGEEYVFDINPKTGLNSTFIYLPSGTYTFGLNFYDGGLLKSVLVDSQATITITENGGSIKLDIVPLVTENTYTYDSDSSTATFYLSLPDDIIKEAGSVDNIMVTFFLSGPDNQPYQLTVPLVLAGSNYEGTVTIPNFVPGQVTWSLQIADMASGSNKVYAYCGQTVDLGVEAQTSSCDVTMAVRSFAADNPMGEVTVIVATNGYAVPGAAIKAGKTFLGLTGNGTNGSVSGQLHLFLPADSYLITAASPDGTRMVSSSIELVGGQSQQLDLQLPAPPNNAPTTENVAVETEEGTAIAISLPGSDPDPWDTVTWNLVSEPLNGTVTLENNTAVYTPVDGFSGTDVFTFTVTDGFLSSAATVAVSVAEGPGVPVNNAPVAKNITVSTNQNLQITITLLGEDADEGDTLTYSMESLPLSGLVTLSGQTATYTPAVDFVGDVTFTYSVSDGSLSSNTATVTITVLEPVEPPVNAMPSAIDVSVSTEAETAVAITLVGIDADEGDLLTYQLKTFPDYGTVSLEGNTVTYLPNPGFSGADDSFTYTVSDGKDTSAPATVTVTVNKSDEEPEPEEDLELTVSAGFRPWHWVKDVIKLDKPVSVIIPSHDQLEVLAGNADRFVLQLKFGKTSCIYLGGNYTASQGGKKINKHEEHKKFRSPVCGNGKYKAGDVIEARKKIEGRLLFADPREPETTIRIKLERAE